jgi:tetratricopeptide (TPR) repeat protein
MRICLLALALLCACAAAKPVSQPLPPDPLTAERQAVRDAHLALASHDYARAWQLLGAIDAPLFEQLSTAEQHQALFDAAFATKELGRGRESLQYIFRACQLPERTLEDLDFRLNLAMNLGETGDAIDALTAIARQGTVALAGVDDQTTLDLLNAAEQKPRSGDRLFLLLEALFDADFRVAGGPSPDWAWERLAVLLIVRGDAVKAEKVVARITSPGELIAFRADNRFAAIVQANPAHFDVVQARARNVEQARALVRKEPRAMRAVLELADALRAQGKDREALEITDEALVRAGASAVAPYDDAARQLPWLRNARSVALWSLGRWQESLDELERAGLLTEGGNANVSHYINLAWRDCELDRGKAALAALKHVDEGRTSPFGAMQRESVRAWAGVETGDPALVERALSYLRPHQEDAPAALQRVLVFAGNLDEAARVLVSRLDDPESRGEALMSLQEFKGGPRPPGGASKRFDVNWKQLIARKDVRDAIAAVGHIERYEIPGP